MATTVIDSGTIEKTSEVTTRYRRKELVLEKRQLRNELEMHKSIINKRIDEINALIAEMDALNVTDEG
jgi:hypothetical protein